MPSNPAERYIEAAQAGMFDELRTTESERDLSVIKDAFHKWHSDQAALLLPLSYIDCWTLVALLQLVGRYPHISAEQKNFTEQLGRFIQAEICDTPELNYVLEKGWNTQYDIQLEPDDK